MRRSKFSVVSVLLLVILCVLPLHAYAKKNDDYDYSYENRKTGYQAVVLDEAELLSEREREKLLEVMEDVTDFGNALFLTGFFSNSEEGTSEKADAVFEDIFGEFGDGVIITVDMKNRYIDIGTFNGFERRLTKSYCNTISDNIYKYASNEDFYGMAKEGFTEVWKIMDGQRVAQPMKLISSAILSLILAVMVNFIVINKVNAPKKAQMKEVLEGVNAKILLKNPTMNMYHKDKVYSPSSSSSGSGSHRSGGHHHSSSHRSGGHHSHGGHHF